MAQIDVSKLHNTQAEVAVLSAILSNPYLFENDNIQEGLKLDIFNDQDCRKCYQVMMELANDGKQPDMLEVAERLKKQNVNVVKFLVEDVGGYSMTMQRIEYLADRKSVV